MKVNTSLMISYNYFLALLKTQLSTFFIQTPSYVGLQWQKNIYYTILLDDPVTDLDCMNQCLNVQSSFCQFFILQDNNCYFGRTDITNGTMALTNSTVTVYTLISKKFRQITFSFKYLLILTVIILFIIIFIIKASLGRYFVTRTGVAGSKWSKYIYMSLPTISKNQCEGLCLLARYSVIHDSIVVQLNYVKHFR